MQTIEEDFLSIRLSLNSSQNLRSLIVSFAQEYIGVIQQEDHWIAAGAGGNGIFLRTQPRIAPPCLFSFRQKEHLGFCREEQKIQVLSVQEDQKPSLPEELQALPIKSVIRRAREMWLRENLRLYLDTVEEVGLYFYAEAIIDTNYPLDACHESLESLCQSFGLDRGEITSKTYLALQQEQQAEENSPETELSKIREQNQEEIEKRLVRLREMMDEPEE